MLPPVVVSASQRTSFEILGARSCYVVVNESMTPVMRKKRMRTQHKSRLETCVINVCACRSKNGGVRINPQCESPVVAQNAMYQWNEPFASPRLVSGVRFISFQKVLPPDVVGTSRKTSSKMLDSVGAGGFNHVIGEGFVKIKIINEWDSKCK